MSPSEIAAWALGHLSQWAAQPLTLQDIVANAAGTIGVALVAEIGRAHV